MQPGKTTATLLFSAPTQYVIPVFQRGYVWTLEKQVAPLWDDIADRATAVLERQAIQDSPGAAQLAPMRKHFLGSLVLTPILNAFGRVSAYEVIDGQQRTTTLHLLLLAFRDVCRAGGNQVLVQMLENLTKNPGPFQVATDHHKVWPTKAGRDEIAFLDSADGVQTVCEAYPIKVGKTRIERPLLIQAYLYLYYAVEAFLKDLDLSEAPAANAERTRSELLIHSIRREPTIETGAESVSKDRAQVLFMTLQNEVQLMTLTLETEDDPQIIFETLNARGEPLLASDLIRNFLFLEATRKSLSVDDLYVQYWKDFDEQPGVADKVTANRYWREKERQGRITHPRIDLFFFHYTVLQRVEETKVGSVFQSYKEWWLRSGRDVPTELQSIQRLSAAFRELISPEGEGSISQFAHMIKALDVTTFIPVYLRLRGLERGDESVGLVQSIRDVESYIVRRAVCGLTSKSYNRIALKLLEILSTSAAPADDVRRHLLSLGGESQVWPSDSQFEVAWMDRPVYEVLRSGKVAAILRALEPSFRSNKQESLPVPLGLSVEHVLPQKWEEHDFYPIADMTQDQRLARERLLHTFGNLTLLTQPMNSSASNGRFEDVEVEGHVVEGKRRKICQSLLSMNAYFQKYEGKAWDNAAIDTRGRDLFKRALARWPKPISPIKDEVDAACPQETSLELRG